VQRPLATVVVGGMLIGPIMFLIVVPALQTFFLRSEGGPQPQPAQDELPL
jgi:cobalt-zinc-cadmium resistance protein CzcA